MAAIDRPGWEGWYFEEDFICSPSGDRFTAKSVLLCLFVRQSNAFQQMLNSGYLDCSGANDSVLIASARPSGRLRSNILPVARGRGE